MRLLGKALTFDDVLLVPAFSQVLPRDTSLATRLSRNITLNLPLVSAAMDTVTEAPLAIALARAGGIGIIHRNLSILDQVAEVDRVKRSQSGMIVDPVTLPADALVRDALALMARYHISGVPITDKAGRLVGLLTNRDLRFVDDEDQAIENVMRRPPLITGPVGTTLEQAKETIKQTLQSQNQQKALETFSKKYSERWKEKTDCREGYVIQQCKQGPKATPTPSAAAPGQGQQVPQGN